jgi:lipopolysaccharide export system protein LptC
MSRERVLVERLIAWSPALFLGSLAALTYWLDAQVQAPASRRDGSARHDPDIYIENIRAVALDDAGRIRESMTAKRAEHYPDTDSVDVLAPSLSLTEPGKPRMSIVADTASVAGDRETVTFRGNVKARRDAGPAAAGKAMEGPASLSTEFLRVDPKKGVADTDQRVTIEDSRGIIEAVGMSLDNNTHTLKLKSGAHGTLQPQAISK